jgi:hypothetical protein
MLPESVHGVRKQRVDGCSPPLKLVSECRQLGLGLALGLWIVLVQASEDRASLLVLPAPRSRCAARPWRSWTMRRQPLVISNTLLLAHCDRRFHGFAAARSKWRSLASSIFGSLG